MDKSYYTINREYPLFINVWNNTRSTIFNHIEFETESCLKMPLMELIEIYQTLSKYFWVGFNLTCDKVISTSVSIVNVWESMKTSL